VGEKTITTKNKEGESVSSVQEVWNYKVTLRLQVRFFSHPENKSFLDKTFPIQAEASFTPQKGRGPRKPFFNQLINSALLGAVGNLSGKICPYQPLKRTRPIFVSKGQKDSEDAYKAIRRQKWEKAERIWKNRTKKSQNNWKDHWNLAVAAEMRHDYPLAKKRYQKSKDANPSGEEAQSISFEGITNDLSQSLFNKSSPSTESKNWFGHRLGVLPFADEVINIDGPDFVRDLIHLYLTKGGYNTIPLDELTVTLRKNGFSEGGQFGATTPKKLAQWLKADWLLFGYLEEFGEVNLGIYREREVAGKIHLWNAKKKTTFWEEENRVINRHFSGLKGSSIGASFLAGLGKSWFERLRKKPLGPETEEFVRTSLKSLPLKPNQ